MAINPPGPPPGGSGGTGQYINPYLSPYLGLFQGDSPQTAKPVFSGPSVSPRQASFLQHLMGGKSGAGPSNMIPLPTMSTLPPPPPPSAGGGAPPATQPTTQPPTNPFVDQPWLGMSSP